MDAENEKTPEDLQCVELGIRVVLRCFFFLYLKTCSLLGSALWFFDYDLLAEVVLKTSRCCGRAAAVSIVLI